MNDPLRGLARVDWSNPVDVAAGADDIFEAYCGHGFTLLRERLSGLLERPRLHPLCERLGFMDKLVLDTDEARDVRVRLHCFAPGYADRPHDHRFTFASRILVGAYVHSLYGDHADVLRDARDRRGLRPIVTRIERAGASYVMTSDAVHSVAATEPTLSLVLRGPRVRAQASILDPQTGSVQTLVSAVRESDVVREAKAMAFTSLSAIVAEVDELLTREGAVVA